MTHEDESELTLALCLIKLSKDSLTIDESLFYQSARENPHNYSFIPLGERKERRKIGLHSIPRKMGVITYTKEWYPSQYSKQLSDSERPEAIIEVVYDVKLANDEAGCADLTLKGFLIREISKR
jgi:hypothetical protein